MDLIHTQPLGSPMPWTRLPRPSRESSDQAVDALVLRLKLLLALPRRELGSPAVALGWRAQRYGVGYEQILAREPKERAGVLISLDEGAGINIEND